jgi:hypothetical protein
MFQSTEEGRELQFLVKANDAQRLAKIRVAGLSNRYYVRTILAGLQSQWEANGELSLDRTLKAALFCLGRQDVQDVSFPMAREEKILQALEYLSLRGAVLPPLKRATPQALAARSSSSTQDMDTYIACW